jgi:hypothetical protein
VARTCSKKTTKKEWWQPVPGDEVYVFDRQGKEKKSRERTKAPAWGPDGNTGPTHLVKHVCRDLALGVSELVESVVQGFTHHLQVHTDYQNED